METDSSLSTYTVKELWDEITTRCRSAVLLMESNPEEGEPDGLIKQRYHGPSFISNALLLEAVLYSIPLRIKFLQEDQ